MAAFPYGPDIEHRIGEARRPFLVLVYRRKCRADIQSEIPCGLLNGVVVLSVQKLTVWVCQLLSSRNRPRLCMLPRSRSRNVLLEKASHGMATEILSESTIPLERNDWHRLLRDANRPVSVGEG